MTTHRTPPRPPAVPHPDKSSPWVFSTLELSRRPGSMITATREAPAPSGDAAIGYEGVIEVRPGSPVQIDLRLESVDDGVYVSGTVATELVGECSRCLDPVSDTLVVDISELYAYPETTLEETTDEDEIPRLVEETFDIEQTVRDAVVLELPLAPLCDDDCLGLCPDCGGRWADLGPDHGHETLDPRWAALRERLPSD